MTRFESQYVGLVDVSFPTWESSTLEMLPSPLIQNLRTTCDESTNRLSKLFINISTTATLPPHFWSIN